MLSQRKCTDPSNRKKNIKKGREKKKKIERTQEYASVSIFSITLLSPHLKKVTNEVKNVESILRKNTREKKKARDKTHGQTDLYFLPPKYL